MLIMPKVEEIFSEWLHLHREQNRMKRLLFAKICKHVNNEI
jgi:hypothetical protein